MSCRFEVIEARAHHCGRMARVLRQEHLEILARVGADAHRELRACFDQSAFRKAWLIDGRLAALGGVTGTSLSADGMVWLGVSEEAAHYPVAVVKEARRQLRGLASVKRGLSAAILPDDDAAARLAVFLGFAISEAAFPTPAISRRGRRLLAREVKCNVDLRAVVANAVVVPMRLDLVETG